LKQMTESNLKDALAGESQAHIKYLNFAEKAAEEGYDNVARLFRAASYSEQVHATKHLKVLSGIGSTPENLGAAVGGEGFEIDEMYPAYIDVAKLQGEATAEKSFFRAYETEKVHHQLYGAARAAVDSGADADVPAIFVCGGCGFTMHGGAPEKCPLCGAPKSMFREF